MRIFLASTMILTAAFIGSPKAEAALISYKTMLNGATETVPNASTATGTAIVTVDTVADTLTLSLTFAGLATGIQAAHIHCCTAVAGTGGSGVATLSFVGPVIPPDVKSGTYIGTLDLHLASSFNPAFLTKAGSATAATATLLAGLSADKAYVNLHTVAFPGGEIEGFLTPAPEPGTLAVVTVALLGLAATRRKATDR